MSHEKAPHPTLSPEAISNGVSYTERENVIGEFQDKSLDLAYDIADIKHGPDQALPKAERAKEEDLTTPEQWIEDLKVTPGFLRSAKHQVYKNAALREKREDLVALDDQWARLGGKAIKAAQLAVDQLNFKSTATDHIYAKAALRDAKDAFAENLRAEQASTSAPAPAPSSETGTPTDDDEKDPSDTEPKQLTPEEVARIGLEPGMPVIVKRKKTGNFETNWTVYDLPFRDKNGEIRVSVKSFDGSLGKSVRLNDLIEWQSAPDLQGAASFYHAVNRITHRLIESGKIDSTTAQLIRSHAAAPSNKDYFDGDPGRNATEYVALTLEQMEENRNNHADPADSAEQEDSKERLKNKEYHVGEYAVVEIKVNGEKQFVNIPVAARSISDEYDFIYLVDPKGNYHKTTASQLNEVRNRATEEGFKEKNRHPEKLEEFKKFIKTKEWLTPVDDGILEPVEWEVIEPRGIAEANIRSGIDRLWKELEKFSDDDERDKAARVINDLDLLPSRQNADTNRGGERQAARTPDTSRPKTAGEWLKYGLSKYMEKDEQIQNAILDGAAARRAKAALQGMKLNLLNRVGGASERNNVPSGVKKQAARMLSNWLNSSSEHPGLRANRKLAQQSQKRLRRR